MRYKMDLRRVDARIPETLFKAIARKVKQGHYASKADFLRTAIRNELRGS
jgi:Arc/MetJ-type ribon-helix-helix transcriptional regulator